MKKKLSDINFYWFELNCEQIRIAEFIKIKYPQFYKAIRPSYDIIGLFYQKYIKYPRYLRKKVLVIDYCNGIMRQPNFSLMNISDYLYYKLTTINDKKYFNKDFIILDEELYKPYKEFKKNLRRVK